MFSNDFLNSLALDVAEAARDYSRDKIPSDTLKRAVQVRLGPQAGESDIYLPHYWAIYVHNGRGIIRGNPVLVYFRNPDDDPRIKGGYPVTKAGVRRLSSSQWNLWLRRNAIAKRRDEDPPMIVVRHVRGTSKYSRGGTHPAKFWDNSEGMAGFSKVGRSIISKRVGEEVRKRLPSRKF